MRRIETLDELHALYGAPGEASLVKEAAVFTPAYRRLIEAAPFFALATAGPEGLDCSPRGDRGAAARVAGPSTLLIPDRRGNDRIDSLRNIIRDPRVALMFLVPGHGNALRVNGRAWITDDAELRGSFAVDGKPPRTVIGVEAEAIYFQCARAIIRAALWDPENRPKDLPTPGEALRELKEGFDAESYDGAWAARAAQTMW